MSALTDNLQRLIKFLETLGQMPPTLEIRVVEIDQGTEVDAQGRLRVGRSAVRAPEAFEGRFDELIRSGRPWINMSSLGVDGGFLIVGIEAARGGEASRTSVNYSGPSASVLQDSWAAQSVLRIE